MRTIRPSACIVIGHRNIKGSRMRSVHRSPSCVCIGSCMVRVHEHPRVGVAGIHCLSLSLSLSDIQSFIGRHDDVGRNNPIRQSLGSSLGHPRSLVSRRQSRGGEAMRCIDILASRVRVRSNAEQNIALRACAVEE